MAPFKPRTDVVYLRDNTASTALGSGLNELRKKKAFCDINIKVGGDTYPAHKCVLSATSGFFKSMFAPKGLGANSSVITLQGVSLAFGSLLRFAYTGNLRLSQPTVGDVLLMASNIQLDKAVALCQEYVKDSCKKKTMSFKEARAAADIAERQKLPEMGNIISEYMTLHFLEFSKTKTFLRDQTGDGILRCLRREDVIQLIGNNSEKQVLKAVLAWLKHDWKNRKPYAAKLLGEVRLGLIPRKDLEKISKVEKIPECKKFLKAVLGLLKDTRDLNATQRVHMYPELCATRTTITAPIIASRKASYYYDKYSHCWTKSRLTTPQVYGVKWATFHHTLIKVNEELYAAGGFYHTLQTGIRDLKTDSFTKYSPADNEWKPLASLNQPRAKCALVELFDYIYAIGGEDEEYAERYSISQGKWSTISKMPVALEHMSAVAHNGNIVVYGVSTDCEDKGERILEYTPHNDTWCKKIVVLDGKHSGGKTHIYPVLTVQDHVGVVTTDNPQVPADKCYLISYAHHTDGSPGKPRVDIVRVTGTEPMTIRPTGQSQFLLPLNDCGAFIIDKQVFVNANGYCHNTGIEITANQTTLVDMKDWNAIRERKQQVIGYMFDRNRLQKK